MWENSFRVSKPLKTWPVVTHELRIEMLSLEVFLSFLWHTAENGFLQMCLHALSVISLLVLFLQTSSVQSHFCDVSVLKLWKKVLGFIFCFSFYGVSFICLFVFVFTMLNWFVYPKPNQSVKLISP